MKFCNKCGKVISEEIEVCQECENENTIVINNEEMAIVYNVINEPKEEYKATTKKKNWIMNKIDKIKVTNFGKKCSNKINELKKNKVVISIMSFWNKNKSIILVILAVALCALAIYAVTSENYNSNKKNYKYYMEKSRECRSMYNSYRTSGGLYSSVLANSYYDLTERWEDMAKDVMMDIWKARGTTIISITLAMIVLKYRNKMNNNERKKKI